VLLRSGRSPSENLSTDWESPAVVRSLEDLAVFAVDPGIDPFDRMCHAATLTNRAHVATVAHARTCAVGGEESLQDLGNVLAMSADDVGRLVGSDHPHHGEVG
jgi:hypothetical protein